MHFRNLRVVTLLLALVSLCNQAHTEVTLLTRDAVVWGRPQTIRAYTGSGMERAGILSLNGVESPFLIVAGSDTFSVPVVLGGGVNVIRLRVDSSGVPLYSDTLRLTLGYSLRPTIEAHAVVSPGVTRLHAAVLDDPDSASLSFTWSADPRNPSPTSLESPFDSTTVLSFPPTPAWGEYLYMATVAAADGDTVLARAAILVDSGGMRPMDLRTDRPRWIDTAVVYGITPSIFVFEGRFAGITAKIPELVRLGVNAIWLQPVYATYRRGQGYDVIDYFRVRSDLGSEGELRQLIGAAHASGIRVLFDFVPNHTSIFHPYAQHSIAHGTSSHYHTYYQRAYDTAPYSQHYRSYQGFVNYFWDELPNLNFDNPEVRQMILEAGKYWIEKFDVDGYRVDVAWGPAARAPEFFKEWRLALKRIKPDALLLAEDKATWPSVFDQRFDAAYDWAPEQSWVSHWVWQTNYSTSSNPTIFNYGNQNQRSSLLRAAMTNSGAGYAAGAKILRFLENNDTFRFRATHDLPRTKMAAAMMFALPGIPLLFNGQEIGAATHPYSASYIFMADRTIESQDTYGLFPFYSQMSRMRKRFPALTGENFAEMAVTPGTSVYAFRRWAGKENLFGVVNMGSGAASVTVNVPVASLGLDTLRTYYLSDQVSGEVRPLTAAQLAPLALSLPPYTTRVYVLDTTAVTSVEEYPAASLPKEIALLQNYPNPFNPSTTIAFELPERSNVRLLVYDLVGREVGRLVEGMFDAGNHSVPFDARGIASGVYFYRLEAGSAVMTRKMMVVK